MSRASLKEQLTSPFVIRRLPPGDRPRVLLTFDDGPTSGVTEDNFVDVLSAGAAGVGFVRPLFVPEELQQGNFDAIEKRARRIHDRLAPIA